VAAKPQHYAQPREPELNRHEGATLIPRLIFGATFSQYDWKKGLPAQAGIGILHYAERSQAYAHESAGIRPTPLVPE